MLVEALLYATTPVPKHLRAMGHLAELIGIRARIARCRSSWATHLNHCRAMIETWAQSSPGRSRAVIMGGAFCHDLPLRALSEQFSELVVIDLAHPWWISLWDPGNVRRLAIDVTGTLSTVYATRICSEPMEPTLPEADLYLSVNLASQLPCVSGDWLEDQGVAEAEIAAWSRRVIQSHFDWLRTLPGSVGLISEIEERIIREGEIVGRRDSLFGAIPPKMSATWTWDIAPLGEVYADRAIRLIVGAAKVS